MVDTLDPVENVVMLAGSDYVFKENSIWRITHLGGETGIFQHEAACQTEGLVAPRLLFANENNVIFAGHSNIYTYGGAASLTPIGDAVKDAFFTALNYLDGIYHRRAHCLYFKDKNLLAFLVPAASAYPDKAWVYDLTQQTWTCWNFLNGTSANVTAGCAYWHLTGNTWDHKMQFGSSGGGLYEWDWTGKNDGAAAITAYWDSKEFCNPQKGRTEYTRWRGCHFEATGDSVTVYYSADGGSWTSAGTFTLTSDWARYFADFNIEAQLLKIRFYNNTVSSTFKVRWFDLMWHEGETH
jgi:hypothetical protein